MDDVGNKRGFDEGCLLRADENHGVSTGKRGTVDRTIVKKQKLKT